MPRPKKPEYQSAPLIERYRIQVSEEKKQKINAWIDEQRTKVAFARSRFKERQKKYLSNWDDFVTYPRTGPFEDASNVHMPLTAIMVKVYHSRLYNIFASEAAVMLNPRETSDEDLVEVYQKLHRWYCWGYINEYEGLTPFAREVFQDVVTVGFGIGMRDFLVKQRMKMVLEPKQIKALKEEIGDLEGQIPEEVKNTPTMEAEDVVDVSQYQEVPKIITEFEGSRVRRIPWNLVHFPNTIEGSNDLDKPQCVIVRTRSTVNEIRIKARQKLWNTDAAEEIVKQKGTPRSPYEEDIEYKKQRQTGVNDKDNVLDEDYRDLEYCFCRYDLDGDNLDEELVVIRSFEGNHILYINYLERVSPTNKRPLFKFDCFSKAGQAYSRGIPEFMYPLNEEMDQTHNGRMNYLFLQTCPFGAYRGQSSLKNEKIRIAPGKFIPVDDINDIKLLNYSGNATILAGEEDRLWQYADRLASVSSLIQGIVPEQVGPLRSTSGVVSLLRQMEKEFKITIDQNAQQWKKLITQLHEDMDRRIPVAQKLRVLGPSLKEEDLVRDKSNTSVVDDILQVNAQVDIIIDVAKLIRSEEIQRADAQTMMQAFAQAPLLMQAGIVTPRTLHKLSSDYLRAFGKTPRDYIGEPKLEEPLTLAQEVQYCAQGRVPPVALNDDHMVKAQQLMALMETPEYQQNKAINIYPANMDELMMRTIKRHADMAGALQPQGMPNPSGEQGQDPNQLMAGTAPQQGGPNPNLTTSRELGGNNAPQPSSKGEPAGGPPASE